MAPTGRSAAAGKSSCERSDIFNEPRQLKKTAARTPWLNLQPLYAAWGLDSSLLLINDNTPRALGDAASDRQQLLFCRWRCVSFEVELRQESKARKEGSYLSRDILGFNVQRTVNRDLPTTTLL